jgi:hypothetical protein
VRVTYTGPHDEVEIPDAAVTVKRGDSIEVADAFGASLIQQSCWDEVKPAKAAPQKKEG